MTAENSHNLEDQENAMSRPHPRKPEDCPKVQRIRDKLDWLRLRYDSTAMSDAVYAVVKRLETDIAWTQHQEWKS
jgi:hypothetical protein